MRIYESIERSLVESLPVIDDVNWRVIIAEMPSMNREHQVTIAATFKVDKIESNSAFEFIINKIHQITSGGQIKLELENNR